MSTATLLVGDVFVRLAEIPDGSIHSVITSPPYWRKRRYLAPDDPMADQEIGQEPSPGAFLATLLRVTDELWRVLRDDGTIWINLGDTAASSGGAGGDYLEGGVRHGQNRYKAAGWPADQLCAERGLPRPKSVCWIPELFGASLAYGRNLLTGEPCRQWITRPPVTWCKPAPTPGEIIDKFREATELFVWAAKQPSYYFDLNAVREPQMSLGKGRPFSNEVEGTVPTWGTERGSQGLRGKRTTDQMNALNPKGAPPLTWWVVNTSGYEGAHFATFPPQLIVRPVLVSCPPGGTILDPFGGSGTTAAVATGHGRDCILIDFDARNADLTRDRVGMFLEVDYGTTETVA